MPDVTVRQSDAKVLVTDFDGTLTQRDFYALVVGQLLPDGTPNYWSEYRAGRRTHFETLQGYFAAIRTDEASLMRVVDQMELDPDLAQSVAELADCGWQVVVASAGCRWYIEKLLARAHVQLEVHANPGQFVPERGLCMELPTTSPFFSPTVGIDKPAIVRHFLASRPVVAFAGDGFPDEAAARLVPDELRFARGDLAHVLTASKTPYQAFTRWTDVARRLIARGNGR